MVRLEQVKKGPWTPEEDQKLTAFIETHGRHSVSWRALPKQAGLERCGKSCRLRWTNYLRPGIRRGNFSVQEENSIIQLHAILGNRWSLIATHLPGRTDNEIKNHWNTKLRKRLLKMGIDPTTHRPCPLLLHQQQQPPQLAPPSATSLNSINTLLLSILHPQSPTTGLPSMLTAPSPAASADRTPNSALFKSLSLLHPSVTISPSPASAAVPPPSSPSFPSPSASTVDPSLLAAAETRLILDCLNLRSPHDSSSDHQLNQIITRLLLLRLLQQQGFADGRISAPSSIPAAGASFLNKLPIPALADQQPRMQNGTACGDHGVYNQGLHSMLGGAHEVGAPPPGATAYGNPNLGGQCSSHGQIPASILSTMSGSSYQQRLLQAMPFLAETMIEACASNTTGDLMSSNQQQLDNQAAATTTDGSPPLVSSPQCSPGLPRQHQPFWLANHTSTAGASRLAANPCTWAALEELLLRGAEKDSSSAELSSSSNLSSASHQGPSPSTSTNNILNEQANNIMNEQANNIMNEQDYWYNNLFNLINPNVNQPPS